MNYCIFFLKLCPFKKLSNVFNHICCKTWMFCLPDRTESSLVLGDVSLSSSVGTCSCRCGIFRPIIGATQTTLDRVLVPGATLTSHNRAAEVLGATCTPCAGREAEVSRVIWTRLDRVTGLPGATCRPRTREAGVRGLHVHNTLEQRGFIELHWHYAPEQHWFQIKHKMAPRKAGWKVHTVVFLKQE